MSERRRVVVTGIGLLSALGDEARLAERLFSGVGGIARLRSLDPMVYRSQSAAELEPEALATALAHLGLRAQDRTTDMAVVVAGQALCAAGLLPAGPAEAGPAPAGTGGAGMPAAGARAAPGSPGESTGVVFGTGSGPSHALQESWDTYAQKGGRLLRPTTVPRCMANAVSSQVSIQYGLRGGNYVVVSSCSSSTVAIGIGYRSVLHGYAERVLCGGSESMFTPALYASWDNLGVMSRHPEPARASRPFDLDRDGFVLGEGAGALVLESLASAQARGAPIRAEVLGFGESSDGTHITRPSVEGQEQAMRQALRSAELPPSAVDFVNAHGTGTKANDATEAEAIAAVFGAAGARPWVASSKPFFGHLLGAAGVVETIACIAQLEHGRLHGNPNLTQPDPACAVRLVGRAAMAAPLRIGMKNSFGFGGGNATLILKRYED
ncbi:MAG: beta-ketoacyl-[acyl-carrier-protein] synthase family protein [Planctomycetes bacterium]|nr:beta-ketoacyl-[acyl-carrier-protein] synthase family protein [Planctomycetota bacterium]